MAPKEAGTESVAPIAKVSDLGRYRLIAELARGGMGIVYLALVRGPGGFNKLFVLKELKAHLRDDPDLVRMFLEEARVAAKLSHPNVVQTIEVGSDGNRHFIAMEYLDGQSLHRAVGRAKKTAEPFPLPFALYVISHMLEGLHYAHSASDFDGSQMTLVHRDVSPHNIFVTYDGQVKVLDFGIAKALGSSNDTRTGTLKGKVAYMAPEQAAGLAVDRRADVFSAGVMLFEAVTGQRFWSRQENDFQILHGLATGTLAQPRTAKADIDPAVERIILKATAVRLEDRYASAADMQTDVDEYARTLPARPVNGREIGRYFSEMFLHERAHLQDVIDKQLRALRGTHSGQYAMIDLPRLTQSNAPSGTPSGVLRVSLPPPMRAPSTSDPALQNPTVYEGVYRPALGGDATLPPHSGERTARARTWVAPAVFVVGVVAMIAVVFSLRSRPAVVAPSTPVDSVLTTAPSSAPQGAVPREEGFPAHDAAISASEAQRPTSDPVRETAPPPGSPPHRAVHHGAAPALTAPPYTTTIASPPPPAPVQPLAPTPTSHVRQQIDTRDPYAQ